jgi:flagellar biogenesis protein FliO
MLEILISPEVLAASRTPLVSAGYIMQLIISLAIVVGLIYFFARYLLPKLQLPSSGNLIQIKEKIGLEPQVSAYIISVREKSYLVVVSNKGVTLIDKLEI